MKKLTLISALIAGLFGASAFADQKIGFVDIRKAVESTKAGKKVETELKAEFKKRETTLKKKAEDIKKMTEDFEKKSSVLSDDARGKKQQEIQEQMLQYNQDVAKNTADIRKKEQEMMQPIFEKMQKVINEIAQQKDYTLVLQSRDNVLYAKKEVDLTEEVIKAFEKK